MTNDPLHPNSNQMYTVEDIAELFLVSERTVYRWIKIKKLKAVQIGRVLRITPGDLDSFVKSSQR